MRRFLCCALLLTGCAVQTYMKKDDGKTVTVRKGARFVIQLSASNNSLHPRYRFSRPRPEVRGNAVEYVGRDHEGPPSRRAGATGRDFYRFRALSEGEVTIQFRRVYDRSEHAHRHVDGFKLTVVVR